MDFIDHLQAAVPAGGAEAAAAGCGFRAKGSFILRGEVHRLACLRGSPASPVS